MRDKNGKHIPDFWDVYKGGVFSSRATDDYITFLEKRRKDPLYSLMDKSIKKDESIIPLNKKKWWQFWK